MFSALGGVCSLGRFYTMTPLRFHPKKKQRQQQVMEVCWYTLVLKSCSLGLRGTCDKPLLRDVCGTVGCCSAALIVSCWLLPSPPWKGNGVAGCLHLGPLTILGAARGQLFGLTSVLLKCFGCHTGYECSPAIIKAAGKRASRWMLVNVALN